MPALRLFGKRTALAGDDLTPSAVLALVLRFIQLGFLGALFPLLLKLDTSKAKTECNLLTKGTFTKYDVLQNTIFLLYWFWGLTLALACLSIPLEVAICKTTRRGSPTEPEKRKLLKPLCYLKFFPLALIRTMALVIGLIATQLVESYCNCQGQATTKTLQLLPVASTPICPHYNNLSWLLGGLVAMNFVETSFAVFLSSYFVFKWIRPHARISRWFGGIGLHSPQSPVTSLCGWRMTCQLFCTCTSLMTCCLFGGLEASFADFVDVAVALETLFDDGGHLDVTASDILAGLILLARQQHLSRKESRSRLRQVVRDSMRFTRSSSSSSDRDAAAAAPASLRNGKSRAIHSTLSTVVSHNDDESGEEGYMTPEDMTESEFQNNIEVEIESDDNMLQQSIVQENGHHHQQHQQQSVTSLVCRRRLSKSDFDDSELDMVNFFEPSEREVLNMMVEEDKTALLEGAHFIKLAHAVYGLLLYIISHPATCCCHLAGRYMRCQLRGDVKGDCLGCNRVTFLEATSFDPDDLIYASFKSGLTKRPYCIAVDREWKALVIVIRGTLSLEDAVADIQLKPQRLDEYGPKYQFDWTGEYCHAGMFASAEWIFEDLMEHGLLKKLLVEGNDFRDFKLYIVGHSLGAGVASILSLLLHQSFRDLKCLCFEPPGCVMSTNLANQPHITSYVLGSDIVPRLSLGSLENLRDDILDMIARTKVPKHKILSLNPFQKSGSLSFYDTIYESDQAIPDSKFARQLNEFKSHRQSTRVERGLENILLVPPGGRIMHLIKTSERPNGCCFNMFAKVECEYTPIWALREDFSVISLASSMALDHDPAACSFAFQNIVERMLE